MDSSGLILVLSGEGPSLPGRKLTQLAKMQMIKVPEAVYLEVRKKDNKVKEWIEKNRSLVLVTASSSITRLVRHVQTKCSDFSVFSSSTADVMVACTALALNNQAKHSNSDTRYVVVATDGELEAACFVLGIERISPRAFVQLFASTKINPSTTLL